MTFGIRESPLLVLMQDGAPSNSASRTMFEVKQDDVAFFNWPVHSPDLKPIEDVRNLAKDFIENKYPDLHDGRDRTYD